MMCTWVNLLTVSIKGDILKVSKTEAERWGVLCISSEASQNEGGENNEQKKSFNH